MGKSSCHAQFGQSSSSEENVSLILAVNNSHPLPPRRGILASWLCAASLCETAQVRFLLLFWSTIIYWESAPHTIALSAPGIYTGCSTISRNSILKLAPAHGRVPGRSDGTPSPHRTGRVQRCNVRLTQFSNPPFPNFFTF